MTARRLIGFAGAAIEIVADDADAGRFAAFVFGRFPDAAGTDTVPCVRLGLAGDGPDAFALWRDGSPVYRAPGDDREFSVNISMIKLVPRE